eukprot:GGOE01062083.1.p1 GENE.GGOE01062083.1~~GGOE01062083.1.p1  ORF type:complete len:643 (+),score=109.85 GGOE01062083.1:74-1930(+)
METKVGKIRKARKSQKLKEEAGPIVNSNADERCPHFVPNGKQHVHPVVLCTAPTETQWQAEVGPVLFEASMAKDVAPEREAAFHSFPLPPGQQLHPFQKAGIDYVLRTRRSFLADEMGLGKTVQALVALRLGGAYPALVVCPATLKFNWQREADLWTPGVAVSIVEGRHGALAAADIIIINFELVEYYLPQLLALKLKGLIVDESQRVKEGDAQVTTAVTKLAMQMHGMPTAAARKKARVMDHLILLLSGTPMPSRPKELLSQLKILGRLEQVFGSRRQFLERYTDPQQRCTRCRTVMGARPLAIMDYSGAANLEELNNKLRGSCFLRRTKDGVLPQLPEKERTVTYVRGSPRLMHDYWDRLASFRAFLNEGRLQAEGKKPMRRSRHMRLLTLESGEEVLEDQEFLFRLGELRQLAAEAKLAAVIEWIEEFFRSQNEDRPRKLVIFAWHRDTVARIEDAHKDKGVVTLTGATLSSARQLRVDAFQTDPSIRIIICNILSAGCGITLTAASDALVVELPWTPAAMHQAEDRLHRIGQEADRVRVCYILTSGTIDDYMFSLLHKKKAVVDLAVDGSHKSPAQRHIFHELAAALCRGKVSDLNTTEAKPSSSHGRLSQPHS